jgi:hypothetical protein
MASKKDIIYSWRTSKISNGYLFTVSELKARKTPNKIGQYVDTKIIKRGVLPTRAKAKSMAQKWVRFYNSKK